MTQMMREDEPLEITEVDGRRRNYTSWQWTKPIYTKYTENDTTKYTETNTLQNTMDTDLDIGNSDEQYDTSNDDNVI